MAAKSVVSAVKDSSPMARMIKTKRTNIERLKREQKEILADAQAQVAKIEIRIKTAQAIIDALEKGSLKI